MIHVEVPSWLKAQRMAGIKGCDVGIDQRTIEVTHFGEDGSPAVTTADGKVVLGKQNALIAWSRMMMVAAGTEIKDRVFRTIKRKRKPKTIG